ncbi:MAG: hypothetical protein Q4A75_05375 [Peptostreptococcaceae bacterium]|nr:hypothetical protein [Peptostreptococcaceae bacterium]
MAIYSSKKGKPCTLSLRDRGASLLKKDRAGSFAGSLFVEKRMEGSGSGMRETKFFAGSKTVLLEW